MLDTAVDKNQGISASVVSKLSKRLLPFLFLLYIVAYLDRINVGFAKLQMQGQLGFSEATFGLGMGVFFAGYFMFQVPSNLVLQKVGARRWVAVIMALWGVISCSMIFVTTPRSFYLLRFLLGAAEAGFFPGIILYLRNWFPLAVQARTIAWFMTAGALSGVVGSPLSGALLGLNHVYQLAGWQWLFLVEGLPAVLLGVIVWIYLTDHPVEAIWLGTEHRDWLVDTLARERALHPAAEQADVFAAFSIGRVWLLVLVYFGLNTVSYGVTLWLPSVIRSLSGVSNFTIGLLSAIPYVISAICMVLVGMHSDRTGERRLHVAVPALIGATALAIGAYSSSLTLTIVCLSIAATTVWSMCAPFWAMSGSLLTGTAAAAGIALINSLGTLGGFFGPTMIGWVKNVTGGFRGGLLVIGATLGLSGCVALLVRIPVLRGGVQREEAPIPVGLVENQ